MPLIDPKSDDLVFATLDWATQNFYWTLRTHLDPLGRITGDTELLISILFPRKRGFVRVADIARWLANCKTSGVLRLYPDSQGRPVIEVKEAVQSKMRFGLKSDYEPPEGQMALELGARNGERGKADTVKPKPKPKSEKLSPEEVEVKRREEKGNKGDAREGGFAAVPTLEEVRTYAAMHAVTEESAQNFFDYYEGKNLWLNKFDRLINWKYELTVWSKKDRASTATSPGARGLSYAHSNKTTHLDRNEGTHNVPTGKYAAHVARKNQTVS